MTPSLKASSLPLPIGRLYRGAGVSIRRAANLVLVPFAISCVKFH